MEQRDYIATLCAAGTLGIAATGLALGVQAGNEPTPFITPGKRKWPGASTLKSNSTTTTTPPPQPLSASLRTNPQPTISTTPSILEETPSSRPLSLLVRPSTRGGQPTTAEDFGFAASRGSSTNRSSLLRPRTADTRSTSERREPSTGSSWLKRISSISSPRASSPNAPSSQLDSTPYSLISSSPALKHQQLPNKLVKRSTSQRALSNDHARGTFLRRPATSHQRSATIQEWVPRDISRSTPATPYLSSDSDFSWRPLFEQRYSRKRHTSTNQKDRPNIRTIPVTVGRQPILLLGSDLEASDMPNDRAAQAPETEPETRAMSTGRHRIKRSLSSVHRAARRRHFTDPTVKVTTEAVNGTMTSAVNQSPFSPSPQSSPLDLDLPPRPYAFNSSPPLVPIRHRFSFRKRQSAAPSDPTTASSDNDTRVFTDDDSMDFQSDSAYDSVNTRATASSHSAFRTPKLDGVFNDSQLTHSEGVDERLARLVQRTTLTEDTDLQPTQGSDQLRGIGIMDIEEESDKMDFEEISRVTTPSKSGSSLNDDYNMTPVPNRLQYFGSTLRSSPPVLPSTTLNTNVGTPEFVIRRRDELENEDDIEWSPKSDKEKKKSTSTLRPDTAIHTLVTSPISSFESLSQSQIDEEDSESERRLSSIFDWSEQQKVAGEGVGGAPIRPKTVHGKQGHDVSRSRSSGRKAPTQMHLRSQSVPNNRDPNAEQAPMSTSKFGTWGLGNKPVSEEWSDDFEFDDIEENGSPLASTIVLNLDNKGTQRGVKVPQAIIDRQASVHIQFGHVQEFMLLVEELKNLRARGAALELLETHSKQLWEDAESIIDLATINNEEDDILIRPGSPTPSDVFGDELPNVSRTSHEKTVADESRKNSVLRTVSSPATPPQGRPRGESLAQAKNFLQSIHQSRSGFDSSPMEPDNNPQKKLPFNTQDLKDLVIRSGVITRALKEIVRKAEGLSASPNKTPSKSRDPAFSQIFNAPDTSPCPPFRKPGLPKSHSANSYLVEKYGSNETNAPAPPTPTALMS